MTAEPLRPVRLILASASPARLATLRRAGVEPVVRVSSVDEPAVVEQYGGAALAAVDVALVLARAKAEDVAATLGPGVDSDDASADASDVAVDLDGALVLGCDSVLELDGEAHGKPVDDAEALSRWRRMRGRDGILHTGHWLIDVRSPERGGTGATIGAVGSTVVHFAEPTDAELAAYVATGEPLAVAGAFTLDGLGGAFVRGIDGDPHNVVGVSLPLLRELLQEAQVVWTDLWADL